MGSVGGVGRVPDCMAQPVTVSIVVVACLWFGCPDPPPPADTFEVAPRATSSQPVDSTYRGMGSDVEQWRGLVSQHFSDVDLALCVMLHESGGNPNAKNPTSSATGLFQVKSSLWGDFGDLYDPVVNVTAAAYIHSVYGWGAWSAYNRGKC